MTLKVLNPLPESSEKSRETEHPRVTVTKEEAYAQMKRSAGNMGAESPVVIVWQRGLRALAGN